MRTKLPGRASKDFNNVMLMQMRKLFADILQCYRQKRSMKLYMRPRFILHLYLISYSFGVNMVRETLQVKKRESPTVVNVKTREASF